jgi:DNA-binding transcriptional ArsR family regulator
MADPLRATILDLLLERAATVAELATAVGRPKSTVAHHVNVLADAGLLRIVRTRRVRAIDERYYGRTARLFQVGVVDRPGEDPTTVHANALSVAAAEARPAHVADELRAILRHARLVALA